MEQLNNFQMACMLLSMFASPLFCLAAAIGLSGEIAGCTLYARRKPIAGLLTLLVIPTIAAFVLPLTDGDPTMLINPILSTVCAVLLAIVYIVHIVRLRREKMAPPFSLWVLLGLDVLALLLCATFFLWFGAILSV